jgi:hypothetical protein
MTAGEAPPKDVLRVLRERWGVGPHLAHALVAHYGGPGRWSVGRPSMNAVGWSH